MLRSKTLLGFFAIFFTLLGLYLAFKPAPELTFLNYADLSAKNIDSAQLKKVVSLHHSCFDAARSRNYLNYAKKNLFLGKSSTMIESIVKRQLEQINQSIDTTFSETKNVTLLRESGEIVGLYSCEDDYEDFEGATVIWNLCVSPETRGKGYGKKLTEHAIKRCSRKGADLTLLVYKDNNIAKKIYEKQGFVIIPWDYDADVDFNYYNKYLMKFKSKAL